MNKMVCDNCKHRENCYEQRLKEIENETQECKRCGTINDGTKPDNCLKTLPGVDNACCGHGGIGYISFSNGVTIRGKFWRCDYKW